MGGVGTAAIAALAVGAIFLGSAILNARPAQEPDYLLITAEEESASVAQEFNIEPLPLPEEPAAPNVGVRRPLVRFVRHSGRTQPRNACQNDCPSLCGQFGTRFR